MLARLSPSPCVMLAYIMASVSFTEAKRSTHTAVFSEVFQGYETHTQAKDKFNYRCFTLTLNLANGQTNILLFQTQTKKHTFSQKSRSLDH